MKPEIQVQHAVITGGGGSLAAAVVDAIRSPYLSIEAPTRIELDVTNTEAVNSYFTDRHIDLLICNAGAISDTPLAKLSEETWDSIFQINYQGAADCAKAVLPQMLSRHSGHIVFISSYSAIHPPKGQAAYSSAKAALIGLTSSLAQQLGSSNIRVNTIVPGFLETPMTTTVTESRKSEILKDHTLGRFNDVKSVAKFIAFLHEHLPNTSGQVFQLDSRPT